MSNLLGFAKKHIIKTKQHYLAAMTNIRSGEVSSEDEAAIKCYVNALELALLIEKGGEHENAQRA